MAQSQVSCLCVSERRLNCVSTKVELSDPLYPNATTPSITCSSFGGTTIDKGENITPEFTDLMKQFAYFYAFITEKGDLLAEINSEISSMRQSAVASEVRTKEALAAMEEQMLGFSSLRIQYEKSLSQYVDYQISKLNTSRESIENEVRAQKTATLALAKDLVS